MVSTGSVAHSELFSSQVNLNSFDDYDLDAIPLHIVRTESFQGMPGHEDLVDSFRGMAAYTQPGETLVDYSEANDYSFDFANEVYIPKPQLSKQSNNVKATTEKGVFHLEKGFPDNSKVVGIPEPKPFLLMKTHWTVTDSTVSRIECKIKNCLKGMPDVSVNPNPVKCQVSLFPFLLENVFSPVFLKCLRCFKMNIRNSAIIYVFSCMFRGSMRVPFSV